MIVPCKFVILSEFWYSGIAEIENKKFVDNLNAKLNEKVEQLNETTTNSEKSLRSLVQEQEKIIRSEIKSNMSDLEENLKHLDDGIGAKLKQHTDDIEMINLKRSNERQEVAQGVVAVKSELTKKPRANNESSFYQSSP